MYSEMLRLNGRKALVTGGSRGIGYECARALGDMGARLVVSARGVAEGREAADRLAGEGVEATFIAADLTAPDGPARLVEAAGEALGGLDILVNNAGVARHKASLDVDRALWQEVIDTNLTSLFLCCQAAIPFMIEAGRGSIVNIGSISGFISNIPQHQVAYNASKAGVHMITKSLAGEFVGHDIRVNAVAPGYVETAMTKGGLEDPEWAGIWNGMTPMGRPGRPSEVASAVLFLASDAASYMTGSIVTVDGGYTLR